ncbi:hypothetical protein Acr_18g0002090 [Actinidia rufa]|uniref:Uncharacterized protein n=1 Tax=Actinidia rufa TaxID=165716 RepID=A0A7J0G5J3_9ERIC|nr:hypothetical protein Acr_18g0002090 [Actinidia rufa]
MQNQEELLADGELEGITPIQASKADDWANFRDDDIMQQQSAIQAVEAEKIPFVGDKAVSAPNKVAFFVWNANHEKIITIDNLIRSIIGVACANLMENQLITLYGFLLNWRGGELGSGGGRHDNCPFCVCCGFFGGIELDNFSGGGKALPCLGL